MDVQKLALAMALLSLAACAPNKTSDSVSSYKSGSQAGFQCPAEQLVKTRFIVKYEDGRIEVVHAENESVFEEEFLKPRLQEIKRVEYDSLITLVHPQNSESATAPENDWGNPKIHAEAAWNQGVYGEGVKVAVIDTAVDYTHPQLANQLAENELEKGGVTGTDDDGNGYVDDQFGWDFILNSSPKPINDPRTVHGTHVAGIILADPTAGSLSGVAPKAKLIPASFIDTENGSISSAIHAIQYAAARGAKIINASWGGSQCSDILKDVMVEVGAQGVLFVVAAGNDGIDYDLYPEYSYPAVFNLMSQITVAASNAFDGLSGFSNRSYHLVHIGAPGDDIRSTVPKVSHASGYELLSGTSMAAPFVSGAAALLWSAKPNATVAQIKSALLKSVDKRAFKVSTQGRLNIEQALIELRRDVP